MVGSGGAFQVSEIADAEMPTAWRPVGVSGAGRSRPSSRSRVGRTAGATRRAGCLHRDQRLRRKMSSMFPPSLHSTPLELTDAANHERAINGAPLTAAPPLLPKTTPPSHHRRFLKGERLQVPLSAQKNARRQTYE